MELEDDLIVLSIEKTNSVPAAQIGTMLLSLDASFRQYGKRRRHAEARLVVHAIRHGSIQILLDAIDGTEKVWQARELLAPFTTHLAEVASKLLGAVPAKVSSADRKAVEAIANPVAKDHATQINLVIHGNVALGMDTETAVRLIERSARMEKLAINVAEVAMPTERLSKAQASALLTEGLQGTAINVHGQWYARLLHMQGVLIPMTVAHSMSTPLQDGQLYRFRGSVISGRRGENIGITVYTADDLGAY